MLKEDCFLFGTIFKLHGYKGEVNIYNEIDCSINFSKIKYLLIDIENQLVPFFIDRIRQKKINVSLVKFEDVESENEAKKILHKQVYIPNEYLPKSKNDDINEKDLINYLVVDRKFGELGNITYINSQTPQKLIYVKNNQKEFCFPMHNKFIKKINVENKTITIDIPKEFIELNN